MTETKNNVLIADDGWLFLNGGNHTPFEFLMGKKKVPEKVIEDFVANQNARKKYCERQSVDYVHVVFPSKPIVKFDKLPDEYCPVFPLTDYSYIPSVIYPKQELQASAESYFQTDTHMTPIGSFIVLLEILKNIDCDIQLSPMSIERQKKGDLVTMLGENTRESYNEIIEFKDIPGAVLKLSNRGGLKGNTGQITYYRNPRAIKDKTVLIFGDSFFEDSLNFLLANIFKQVLYIRSTHFLYEIIPYVEPDIILTGQAERYIPSITADTEREFPFIKMLDRSFYEQEKVDNKFDQALKHVLMKDKKSKSDAKWRVDIDAYALMQRAKHIVNVDGEEALFCIRKARSLVPQNEYLANLEREYSIE